MVDASCRECGNPRLRSFRGRAMDYTPKARILNLLGYATLPNSAITITIVSKEKMDSAFLLLAAVEFGVV